MKRITLCPWTLETVLLLAIALMGPGTLAHGQTRDAYTAARQKMVEEMIAAEGVTNQRVLESMRTVPRHLFVRPALRPLAYQDTALDIGQKQTISPPFIVAYMTEILDPQPTDRVLEIGTGSGYQAAVLSSLVKDVYTIEIVEPLGKRADSLLKSLKYENVHTRIGDGYLGWPQHAPFDKIIVTCSPEKVPTPLIEQLSEGGRMIVPLGERYQQVFYLFEKKDGKLEQTRLLPALFVPMTGKAESTRKVLPDPLNPRVVNGGFEEDVDENLQADGWHWHRRAVIDSEKPFVGKSCLKFENDQMERTSHVLQAFAIDGSQITSLDVTATHRQTGVGAARDVAEQPGVIIHYYDGKRLPIAQTRIGPWLDDETQWHTSIRQIPVPREAREAIIQLGLNGSTGMLWVDEVSVAKGE